MWNIIVFIIILIHKFHFSISVISVEKHALWISQDFGRTWKKVSDSVVQMRWDPTNKNILYFSKDPTNAMSGTVSLLQIAQKYYRYSHS